MNSVTKNMITLLYNRGHPKYPITSCRNEEMAHIAVAVRKTGKYT